ncbi:MAG: glycosyltransferase family 87 protein [Aeromicrobium sp.]|uniref:DUF2029 domain-containing protein n=1 Tax=Aeromicrobium sp. TaxID=1871063 RepID=UPI003C5FCC64
MRIIASPSRRVAVGAVFVLAFVLRTIWPVADGAFLHQSNTDEGVYYATASALLHGMTPYGDLVFLHPPGILIILAPFALVGMVVNDSVGIFLAREAFVLLGCLNAALVTRVLWHHGKTAAIAGGVIYASWGVTVISEFRLNLVTVQSTMFLLALLIVARWPRRIVLAGALIGLTCIIKIWAVPYVLVALPFVLYRLGRPAFFRFATGLVVAPATVALPFVILHPTRAMTLIVGIQVDRESRDLGWIRRVSTSLDGSFHDGHFFAAVALVTIAGAVGIIAPTLMAVARRESPRTWPDAAWLGSLLALQAVVLILAPSFFRHYTAFIAPAGALALGLAIDALVRRWRPLVAVIPTLALASTVAVSMADRLYIAVPHDSLAAAVEDSPCVWTLRTSDLAVANALTSNLNNDCGFTLDPYGRALQLRRETGSDLAWNRLARQQLVRADAVIPSDVKLVDDSTREFIWVTFDAREAIGPNYSVRTRRDP